jgi:hypothetical protein
MRVVLHKCAMVERVRVHCKCVVESALTLAVLRDKTREMG